MLKRIMALAFVLFVIIYYFGCSKKNSVVIPVVETPEIIMTITLTATSVNTVTNTPEHTTIETAISTAQNTATNTATTTPIATLTLSLTNTKTLTETKTATSAFTAVETATLTVTNTLIVTETATSITIYEELVPVPGGTFTQTDGVVSFSHTISSFKIGKYEITYDLWYKVYQWALSNGYTFQNLGAEGKSGTPGSAPSAAKYQPVTTISWRDAIVWCNAYSEKNGMVPVYFSNAGFTAPLKSSTNYGIYGANVHLSAGSFDNPYVNWSANGFRLATEGEYQYAASFKDGSNWTPFNYASGATADYTNTLETGLVSWYDNNSSATTYDVGGKAPNALGIYDMSGNINEWCWDWEGAYPVTGANYRGDSNGSLRVTRGGNYNYPDYMLQVGRRNASDPFTKTYYYGFRVAKSN